MKKLLTLISIFTSIIFLSISTVNAENDLNEYEQRKQDAENIINSLDYINEDTSYYEEYVYVTEDSAKYHYYGCSELKSTPHKVELATAINRGYYSCEKCSPFADNTIKESEKIDKGKDKIIIALFIIVGILIIYIIINEIMYKKESKK